MKLAVEGSVKKSDRVDIYRDNNVIVIRPLTHQASCKYGAFTKWCISAPSADYVWNEAPGGTIVIFVLQRNYTVDPEKQNKIKRFVYLKDKEEDEGLTDMEQMEYENFIDDPDSRHEVEDLSKIALVTNTSNPHHVEIWDANNWKINDNYPYGLHSLPIPRQAIDAIETYLQTVNKPSAHQVLTRMINEELQKYIINERKSKFEKLKDNKVPLTDEERKEVIDADAVWGNNDLAVWKSVDPKTKEVTYITHTHRAFNTRPTLKGAISRYHKFIKGTA